MRNYLAKLGFDVHLLSYADFNGTAKVALEARREPVAQAVGQAAYGRGIGYFCHNDVVSVEGWDCEHGGPFDAVVADGRLGGRGACDMKGSAACALAAVSRIEPAQQQAPLFYFVTGDEECGMTGADLLSRESRFFQQMVDSQAYGIIGEPTELRVVNAHKGGCHIQAAADGIAAHSSTREGVNANWKLIPFLSYLREVSERCDRDPALRNEVFEPPTVSLNLVVENHPNSSNITVGQANCTIFFRPMTDTPWRELRSEIIETAEQMELSVRALRPLPPLHTRSHSEFLRTTLELLKQPEPLAVPYATDGCCLQDLDHLIVLGPGSIEQAHRPDEWIALEQLERGTELFRKLFVRFACRD